MIRYFPCLIFLLLFPGTSSPFQFDVWKSGSSIQEAMAIARDRDIPIRKEGIISANKRFDPNTSTKYMDSANDFYYNEKLLGENAKVNLIFTPQSKFLSTVTIRWGVTPKNPEFREQVFKLISGKYGHYTRREKQIFFEKFIWAIDKTNLVSIRTGGDGILLEYVDLPVYEHGQKEIKKERQENWRISKDKDASKF